MHALVKSSRISIEAHYKHAPVGNLRGWIDVVKVGGSFVQNNELIFNYDSILRRAEVTWNGQPIFQGTELEVSLSSLVHVRTVDRTAPMWEQIGFQMQDLNDSPEWTHRKFWKRFQDRFRQNPLRMFVVTLPLDVELVIDVFDKNLEREPGHLDLFITMRPEPEGQTGQCGNFNGDANDDPRGTINPRRLTIGTSAFGSSPEETATEEIAEEIECSAVDHRTATAVCTEMCGGVRGEALATVFVESCIHDVCLGGLDLAVNHGVMARQAKKEIASLQKPTLKLVGEGCCKPSWDIVKMQSGGHILDNIPNLTRTECAVACNQKAACEAFAISGCNSSSDMFCGGACHLYQSDLLEETSTRACHESTLNGNTFCYTVQ